jgi:Mrp family chromosome partitioning ATPase
MPAPDDALSKAFEESLRDLDALVEKAGRTEGGVSGGERQNLMDAAPALPASSDIAALEELLGGTPVAAAPPPAPAAAEPPAEAAAPTEPATPAEPEATFTPSGVIRRRTRRDDEAEGPGGADFAAPPPGEDCLAACRRVEALAGGEDFRLPALAAGVDGLVRLMRTGRAGRPAALAVCGAGPRAGTTTVALAAALRLAEDRSARVLFAEAGPGSRLVADMLGRAPAGPDFRAVLRGQAGLAEALVHSACDNLCVLPGGDGWSGIESSDQAGLAALAEACRAHFGFVVFDAGDAAGQPGALRAAGALGRAALVVRAGRITARTVTGLESRLAQAGATLAGAILTFAGGGG